MRGTERKIPNKDKKRATKRKTKRLAFEAEINKLKKAYKQRRADLNLIMVRGEDELVFGVRRGLFGHPAAPILRMKFEEIVGATEDVKEMGALVTKLGVLAMSQMIGYNLAYGTDDMAKALAKWCKIDLEALKAEATLEAAKQGDPEAQFEVAKEIMSEHTEALVELAK